MYVHRGPSINIECIYVHMYSKFYRITVSYLKRLTNAALGRLQAFRMYGGIGISASSLHRESTDSLIIYTYYNSYGHVIGVLQCLASRHESVLATVLEGCATSENNGMRLRLFVTD